MSPQSTLDSTNASTSCFFRALVSMFLIILSADRAAKHDDTVLLTCSVYLRVSCEQDDSDTFPFAGL